MMKFYVVGQVLVHHKLNPYQSRIITKILMIRAPGPYIVLIKISRTIWDCQRLPSKYCGLHHIPITPLNFEAERLYCLYSMIITEQRVDAENKRFDVFGDTSPTHLLPEVLGGISNTINVEKYWQDLPITNQTHYFYNITDIYQLPLSTPLTAELCTLLMMKRISFSFTSSMISIYIYIYISL